MTAIAANPAVRTTAPRLGRLWPEPWASQVAVEAEFLRGHLNLALARTPTPNPVQDTAKKQVESMLDQVYAAIQPGSTEPRRLPSLDRWKGATVERAFGNLHGARVALVDVLADTEVASWFPEAVGRVSVSLPAKDPSRVRLEKQLTSTSLTPDERRTELKQALQLGYDANDRRYAQVRSFRNLLWKLVVCVFVFTVGLIVVLSVWPDLAPLCFHPQAAAGAAQGGTICPTGSTLAGDRGASGWDVRVVALMGLIGGALAATFAIRKLRGTDIPYDVPLALAVLKVPLSGLTAIAGILFMTGGFVPGLSDLDSQGQILSYAVLFGYAQQVLTQVVDNRAQTVLSSVPSTEPPPAGTTTTP